MQGPAVDDRSSTEAGANGEIHERPRAPAGPPAPLGQGRAVHVGVPPDRDAESPAKRPRQVGARPPRFGRGGDVAVPRRVRSKFERAKRSHSQALQRSMSPEEIEGPLDGDGGILGGEPPALAEPGWAP